MYQRFSVYMKFLSVFFVLSILFPSLVFARAGQFEINCPYWFMLFDRAGYLDITEWYQSSEFHEFGPHEMMTGDFSAAVHFSGLNETDTAEWLTDSFVIPSFPTGSPFNFKTHSVANDPCNPVWEDSENQPTQYIPGTHTYSIGSTGNDSGWSKVDDDKLEVTTYYEVVDLAFDDPNNNTARSPLSFVDDDESFYVNSERYVLLMTYVFRNITDSNTITGLEFYQLLHGHPADAYSNLAGGYNTIAIPDCLEDYEPFNSVHCAVDSNTVGNFRYDMTQWNITTGAHQDYLTFSSTVAPDNVGLDEFIDGGLSAPMTGTYVDVVNRNLNGSTSFENNTMAGAMMWNLPDLEPNQTTSITLALMYGCGERSDSGLWVEKYDNIDPNGLSCVDPTSGDPNDYKITYTIEYGNSGSETVDNCVLTDYLPDEVVYPVTYTLVGSEMVCSDPNYNQESHTYVWDIGTLEPNDTGSVTLTVYANSNSEPGGEITNEVILNSDLGWVKDIWETPVCCYDSNIIYVNRYATGIVETGTNWTNAYRDLQDALDRVRDCNAVEIWVARGLYKPDRETETQSEAFELIDGTPIYGGFNGTETSRSQRDFIKNKTILSGDIDTDGSNNSNKIVSIDACDSDTILDGFIITDGLSGIYAKDSTAVITNCIVADNLGDGITCKDSDIEVSWSIIKNNTGTGADGIYVDGSTSNPTIINCKIRDNEAHGINVLNGGPTIKNSWIHHNDCGIYLDAPTTSTIRGNTICDNDSEGIIRSNNGTSPNVSNCILWGNDMSGDEIQIVGAPTTTTFSCIYDPNTSSSSPDEDGNITAAPMFAYPNPDLNNYHLDPDSPCEDKGNDSGSYTGEKDIDNEDRVYGSYVDMGADEITCEEVSHELDWSGDGIINMEEFSVFSKAWLSHDPNDPAFDPNLYSSDNWDERCDFDDDYAVDVNNFIAFADVWLWQACYKDSQEGTLMMLESLGGYDGQIDKIAMTAELSIDSFQKVQVAKARKLKAEAAAKTAISTLSVAKEPTLEEQLINIKEVIDFLEKLWLEDSELQEQMDEKQWDEFMKAVYESLDVLQDQYNSKE